MWKNQLNGAVTLCGDPINVAELLLGPKGLGEQKEREALLDKIHQAAEEILRESGKNLTVRVLAIEEPTVDCAIVKAGDKSFSTHVQTYAYRKESYDGKTKWTGAKRIYTGQ